MGYKSTLETAKIESALLASLKTKKIEYNITQDKSSNYASLAEAIAAVDDDEYKVKGIVLTFYTGTDWVSKRYNGEDASGFATETNWVDAGGAAGGTQYLDLSMFSEESGTLSDEDYQKVVKAYENKIGTASYGPYYGDLYIYERDGNYFILINALITEGIGVSSYNIILISVNLSSKSYISFTQANYKIYTNGTGTKALTDNGQYAEFAKPVKIESGGSGGGSSSGSGSVTKQIKPNTFYKFGGLASITITLATGKRDILNEYMFEFVSGSTPTTLLLPETVKWSGGSAPTIEANKTYQVSIVNNLAVYAAF